MLLWWCEYKDHKELEASCLDNILGRAQEKKSEILVHVHFRQRLGISPPKKSWIVIPAVF